MRYLRALVILLTLVGGMGLTGCAAIRVAEKQSAGLLFSAEQERALGLSYHEQISQEYTIIDDPKAQAWLDDMGAKLVAESPVSNQTFEFYLTDSQEVNAFAIPGGHCYVNVGLINYADNEAQVAAVVGHEINHVTQRHGLLRLQREVGVDKLTQQLTGGIQNEMVSEMATMAVQTGGYATTRGFGRDDERESDTLGVEAMYKAGWDPREAATFFSKLQALQGGYYPTLYEQIMMTHPLTQERIDNINQQVAGYQLTPDLKVNTPLFQEIQADFRRRYPAESAE